MDLKKSVLDNNHLNLTLEALSAQVACSGRIETGYINQVERYRPDSGWAIIDKHSSNGTKLNQRDLQPDVPMTIKAGDIVTLANINLQVSIS